MASINIDALASAVLTELDIYAGATIDMVESAVKETAKDAVKELRFTSPAGASGQYSRSWKCARDSRKKGKMRYDMIVYADKPEYRLTHLLEHGHVVKRKGKTYGSARAFPHIADAEDHAATRLLNRIKKGIEDL